jgi:hypothetical protein
MSTDAWRSAAFILGSGVLIWLWSRDKLRKTYALGGVLLLTIIDLVGVDKRFFSSENFISKSEYDSYFTATPADEQILRDQTNYRVLNFAGNTFNDSHTSYYHKSVGGYSAVKLRRYQELIENQLSKNNREVIDMLNTKYVITKGKSENELVQQNPGALGNAWFVDSLMWVENADEEMNRIGPTYSIEPLGNTAIVVNGKLLRQAVVGNHDKVVIAGVEFDPNTYPTPFGRSDTLGIERDEKGNSFFQYKSQGARDNFIVFTPKANFNPRAYAVIDKRFQDKLQNFTPQRDPEQNIQLTSYAPNKLTYSSNGLTDGFVVFSEIYYPDGWDITIDGKPAEMVRVNYVLRGMKIPAGKHNIEFYFHPESFYTGEKISLASSGLLLLLLIGLIVRDFMERRKKEAAKA